jgi:hydroxyacylglutathione hydrolase
MFFRQYYLGSLAHASYLLADESTGTAVVVDPQRDIQQYLSDAAERSFTIRHVFLTHFHADFVAGHLELRDRCGALIHLGSRARAEYSFAAMRDGDSVELPELRIQVLETPGHTIESVSLVVFDLNRDREQPWAVLTGDTLFIGDVGRPDLRVSLGWSAAELGGYLYDSLQTKLLPLPDATLIYPAHGAGSLCGRSLSSETVSTLGEQRRFNYALQPMSCEEFIQIVTADQPDAPPYFAYDALRNTQERVTLDHNLRHVLRPMAAQEFLRCAEEGAQVLDVRDSQRFASSHLRGSINIGLKGQFSTWAGTVLAPQQPIVLIAEPNHETEAAIHLGRIGFDQMRGFLSGGMEALADRRDLLAERRQLSAEKIETELAAAGRNCILDVRTPHEYAAGHIAGSRNLPLIRLREHLSNVPRDRHLYLHCAAGYRSSIAASLLAKEGFAELSEMSGGLAAWEAAGLPLVREQTPAVQA